MQDAVETFETYLRTKNLKHSKPRRDILDVFLGSQGHLSAQDLYDQVKQINPRVGFATVYRTLKLLEECGLARSMDYGDGTQRYEPDRFQHHHIICTSCNRTVEFLSPELEELLQNVQASHDYLPQAHAVRILSLCQDCTQAPSPSGRHSRAKDFEAILSRDALEVAMTNEEQGLQFYTHAVEVTADAIAKSVFRKLAEDEAQHLRALQQEYNALRRSHSWLDDEPSLLYFDYDRLQSIFPKGPAHIRDLVQRIGASEALKLAMDAERRSQAFFSYYATRVAYAKGRAIFAQFAQEEERHLQLIHDAYQAIKTQSSS
ncbi:transcriptional repressor [Candidatus Entotheonella palauensis]|nr:transcriptional repressor [Candidatus Entotheonella palauensis]